MLANKIIEPIARHSEAFARSCFSEYANFCLIVYSSLCLLWFLSQIYQSIVQAKPFAEGFLTKLLILSIIGIILSANNHIYWDYIHTTIKELIDSLSNKVIYITPQSTRVKVNNAMDMINTIESGVAEAVSLVWQLIERSSWMSALPAALYGVVVAILLVVTEAIFCLYFLGSTLKLAVLGGISPFLIMAFGFEKTRHHALAAIKYVLSSILVLVIASFSMGLIMFALREVVVNLKPGTIPAIEVFNAISMLFVLSFVSIYFLLIAPEMASTIMGSVSNSILPGLIGGGIASGALLMGTKAFKGTGHYANNAFKASSGFSKNVAHAMTNPRNSIAYLKDNIRQRFNKNYGT